MRVASSVRLLVIAGALVAPTSPSAVAIAQKNVVEWSLAPANLSAFFDCLRENRRTVIAAHRGGPAAGFPENAIATFENTLRQVPALLEIDIARTRDGVLVLMNDETVDRTTTGSGRISDLTWSQVRTLRLKDRDERLTDVRVPTLREALVWSAGRAVFELDVKDDVPYADVIAEVRAADAMDRVIFITHDDNGAARVHELAPAMMISVSIDAPADLDALVARGVDLRTLNGPPSRGRPDS